MSRAGYNGGPPLDGGGLSLDAAQELAAVYLRPSHVQRHCGSGSPARKIVYHGKLGPIGRWLLLECGHWREVRDFQLRQCLGLPLPKRSRCGCCRLGYRPTEIDRRTAERLTRENRT